MGFENQFWIRKIQLYLKAFGHYLTAKTTIPVELLSSSQFFLSNCNGNGKKSKFGNIIEAKFSLKTNS